MAQYGNNPKIKQTINPNDIKVMTIRVGTKEDLPQVLDLVKELATYEKAPDEVTNTVEMMEEDGFGPNPIFGLFVAEEEGKIVGISIYYYRYSTWKGKRLYLEDIVWICLTVSFYPHLWFIA